MPTRANTATVLPTDAMYIARRPKGFIADALSPEVFVDKQVGKYPSIDDSNFLMEDDTTTAVGGSSIVDFDFGYTDYNIIIYGDKAKIDMDVYNNADSGIQKQMKMAALNRIKDNLYLNKEYRYQSVLFNSSNFSGQTAPLTGTSRWNNINSKPSDNFKTAFETVSLNSPHEVNSLIINPQVAAALANNPDVQDLMGEMKEKTVTKAVLSKLFSSDLHGVSIAPENIYIGGAKRKTALGASNTYIWGKSALFCYIDPKAKTIGDTTLVKTMRLSGNKGETTKFYPDADEDLNILWAKATLDYGIQLVDYTCGYLFTTVID